MPMLSLNIFKRKKTDQAEQAMQIAEKGYKELLWRIFKALRWYKKKNDHFSKKDAAKTLKHYADILEQQDKSDSGKDKK